jgi:hypothetical protein
MILASSVSWASSNTFCLLATSWLFHRHSSLIFQASCFKCHSRPSRPPFIPVLPLVTHLTLHLLPTKKSFDNVDDHLRGGLALCIHLGVGPSPPPLWLAWRTRVGTIEFNDTGLHHSHCWTMTCRALPTWNNLWFPSNNGHVELFTLKWPKACHTKSQGH